MVTIVVQVDPSEKAVSISAECCICGAEIEGKVKLPPFMDTLVALIQGMIQASNFGGLKTPGYYVCSDECLAQYAHNYFLSGSFVLPAGDSNAARS